MPPPTSLSEAELQKFMAKIADPKMQNCANGPNITAQATAKTMLSSKAAHAQIASLKAENEQLKAKSNAPNPLADAPASKQQIEKMAAQEAKIKKLENRLVSIRSQKTLREQINAISDPSKRQKARIQNWNQLSS